MSKDAYYFSHDSNARNDQRLMKVRMKYGMEGHGIFFGIIEILREQKDYTLTFDDIDSISFDLRVDKEKIEDIVENYDLFEIKGHTMFYSKSLMRRMLALDEKRQKLASAGKKGGLSKARKMLEGKSKLGSSNKVKESKINKTKVNNINKRMLLFKESLQKYKKQYGSVVLLDFYNYWSEPNPSNTKMKFELEKTFDVSRRISRWVNSPYNKNKNDIKKPKINFRQPDGKNYIAYCSKCNNSDFYEPFNFKPELIESKCCNAEILNERRVDVKSI
jgi:hypothetical protein